MPTPEGSGDLSVSVPVTVVPRIIPRSVAGWSRGPACSVNRKGPRFDFASTVSKEKACWVTCSWLPF